MTPLILIGNDPTDSDWQWPHWFWLTMTPLILIGNDPTDSDWQWPRWFWLAMTPLILIDNDPTDSDWQYNTDWIQFLTWQIPLLEITYNVFHFKYENGISLNNYIGNPLISTLQSCVRHCVETAICMLCNNRLLCIKTCPFLSQ